MDGSVDRSTAAAEREVWMAVLGWVDQSFGSSGGAGGVDGMVWVDS